MFLRFKITPGNAEREQNGRDNQELGERDRHDGFSPAPRAVQACNARFQIPCLEATLRTSTASAGVRAFWIATFWRFTPALWRKRQDDGADHGGQQDEPRRLEQIDILGVEHPPERHGIRHAGRHRRRDIGDRYGPNRPGANDESDLDQNHEANDSADRQILQKSLFQFGEIDVEHHDDEEEQDRDRADIDDDQDHRQKFRPEQHKQPRRVEKGEDQKQHRVNRIARGNHHEGGADHHRREQIKKPRSDIHRLTSFIPFPARSGRNCPSLCRLDPNAYR